MTWKQIKTLLNSTTAIDDSEATDLIFGPPHNVRIIVTKPPSEEKAKGKIYPQVDS